MRSVVRPLLLRYSPDMVFKACQAVSRVAPRGQAAVTVNKPAQGILHFAKSRRNLNQLVQLDGTSEKTRGGWPVPASSTARATTTPQSLMSAKPFANIWNAASLPTDLPGRGVTIVDTTTSWPIPAKAVAFAPRAIPQRVVETPTTPHGSRLSAPAGAPVGALRPEAAALLHAA